MNTIQFRIDRIPAILYGNLGTKVYLYVHGKLGHKEEAEAFAELACLKEWQVLSIDLPGHGERKDEMSRFVPWHVVPELQTVMQYIQERWSEVALYANSIGAWFSILAYENVVLKQCLLVSPILDMKKLIENMMSWAGVTEQELKEKQQIETNFGETLDWQYYQYAKEKEPLSWTKPTYILYAGKDHLTDRDSVNRFTKKNHCKLMIMEEGEHWFHTPEQLRFLEEWIQNVIK